MDLSITQSAGLPLGFNIWKSDSAKSLILEVTLYIGKEEKVSDSGNHKLKSRSE
jgi:hypothetical protein